MAKAQAAEHKADFSVSHLKDAVFESAGLRAFFEYRDLGIEAATGGRAGGHVIRAKSGAGHGGTGWHRHVLDMQLVYILKGWVKFDYEGAGEVLLEAGTFVHQPPGIRHVEIDHSDDVEILEITLPAEFGTEDVAAPEDFEAVTAGAAGK